jgi:hypothetical protein
VSTACPACHEAARCVAYRGKTLMSLLGPLYLERHYYHCAACGQGFCPWEGVLGVTAAALSPAAAEVACIAGVQPSFAEASEKVLPSNRTPGARSTEPRAGEKSAARERARGRGR